MTIRTHLLGAIGAASLLAAPAFAATDTFDTVNTGPGGWHVDRYAPAGFESASFDGDNRLHQTISENDGLVDRPAPYQSAFYNTQGRKFDLAPGVTSASIDLYIDPTWLAGGRKAGFWATGRDAGNAVAAYPIIEFNNGGFRVWDSNAPGSWTNLLAPISTGWNTLIMTLNGANIDYTVGGVTTSIDALGATSFGDIILQGYNTEQGTSYGIYWDNLSIPALSGAVPEPSSWAMMIGGFALVGAGMRRRRTSVAFA